VYCLPHGWVKHKAYGRSPHRGRLPGCRFATCLYGAMVGDKCPFSLWLSLVGVRVGSLCHMQNVKYHSSRLKKKKHMLFLVHHAVFVSFISMSNVDNMVGDKFAVAFCDTPNIYV
jgi:hypothetical protein